MPTKAEVKEQLLIKLKTVHTAITTYRFRSQTMLRKLQDLDKPLTAQWFMVNSAKTAAGGLAVGSAIMMFIFPLVGIGLGIGAAGVGVSTTIGDWITDYIQEGSFDASIKQDEQHQTARPRPCRRRRADVGGVNYGAGLGESYRSPAESMSRSGRPGSEDRGGGSRHPCKSSCGLGERTARAAGSGTGASGSGEGDDAAGALGGAAGAGASSSPSAPQPHPGCEECTGVRDSMKLMRKGSLCPECGRNLFIDPVPAGPTTSVERDEHDEQKNDSGHCEHCAAQAREGVKYCQHCNRKLVDHREFVSHDLDYHEDWCS